MTLVEFAVFNDNGECVGKFEQTNQPETPDDLSIEEVDDLSKYECDWDKRLVR